MKLPKRASRMFPGLPPHAAGQRIGLYGGSFNPPHAGHRHVSLLALRRLGLDRIWWLVTPGNPLKDAAGLTSQERRMREAAEIAAHPRIWITGVECQIGSRYTADVIRHLKRRAPSLRFVWIMGSDNLAQLHLWRRWTEIPAALPIAVVNRPGTLEAALSAPAARALAAHRLDEADAARLAVQPPPAWTFLIGPRSPVSSTELRARRKTS